MLNRCNGSYRQVIQAIKNKIIELTERRWRPVTVISDLEQASITAFVTEFPGITVQGCYFHFKQALWRAIQRLGLVNSYRNSRRLKKCVKKVMALGFLPIAIVRINFDRLRLARGTRQLIREYPSLRDFLTYFKNNYIDGIFPPRVWNVFNRRMEIRTNNHVESYHRRWNQAVGVRHPSIWVFFESVEGSTIA